MKKRDRRSGLLVGLLATGGTTCGVLAAALPNGILAGLSVLFWLGAVYRAARYMR